MSVITGKYRAKTACRAGGFYRRAGEVFEAPRLAQVPPYLEELGAQPDAGKKKTRADKPVSMPKEARTNPPAGRAEPG